MRIRNDGVDFSNAADESIVFSWEALGVAVVMDPAGQVRPTPAQSRANAIVTRLPRRVRLSVYERVGGRPVLRDERPYLVVDSACATQVIKLRRSLWARRSTQMRFSDLGVMTHYGLGSTSAAAAAVDSAGELPKTISDNLEEAAKLRNDLSALAPAAASDGLNERVQHKQRKIVVAGLAASDEDRAELERLKQAADQWR